MQAKLGSHCAGWFAPCRFAPRRLQSRSLQMQGVSMAVWPLRQRNGGAMVMMVRWESFFHHCSLEILMHVSTVTFQIKVKHMISRESEVQWISCAFHYWWDEQVAANLAWSMLRILGWEGSQTKTSILDSYLKCQKSMPMGHGMDFILNLSEFLESQRQAYYLNLCFVRIEER